MSALRLATLVALLSLAPLAPLHGQAPVASPDLAGTCANTALFVNVLANDSAPAGLQCGLTSVSAVTPPAAGSVVVTNDPSCVNALCNGTCARFTPAAGFTGNASFSYTIRDTLNATSTALVTVSVGNAAATCSSGSSTRTLVVQDCYGCPAGATAQWSSLTGSAPKLHIAKVALGPGERVSSLVLQLVGTGGGTIGIESRDPLNACNAAIQQQIDGELLLPASVPQFCASSATFQTSYNSTTPLAPFDGTVDFAGPSGATILVPQIMQSATRTLTNLAGLAAFVDSNALDGITEFVDFDHRVVSNSSFSPCSPCTFMSAPVASITLIATYTICSPGVPFCAGDGSGTACPCGNHSPAGANRGCLNSAGSGGALRASGVASIASDSLHLDAGSLTGSTAVFFQGTVQDTGGLGFVLGDGLRCVNGAIVRLGTGVVTGGSSSYPSAIQIPIATRGGVVAPGTRYYQVHYRNAAAFCTPATFNLTNGLTIEWQM